MCELERRVAVLIGLAFDWLGNGSGLERRIHMQHEPKR